MIAPKFRIQPTSTKVDSDPPSDPTLLSKFKCHPTIPCDIPKTNKDLDALWYHIPDDLLPTNWSSDWTEFDRAWFLPYVCDAYSMGELDIALKGDYRIPYPIKGVMYCTVEWLEPGGLFEEKLPPGNHECIVFQDALGEYYFYYLFSQGSPRIEEDEYLAKFRTPCGTSVTDFVKQFRGAVIGVDMDRVLPEDGYETQEFNILDKEQKDLFRLQEQARAQSCCACWRPRRDRKLEKLRPVE